MGCPIETSIGSEADILVTRTISRQLAESIGMDVLVTHAVMTAVAELGWNVLRHAGGGTLALQVIHDEEGEPGIEVTTTDSGPGIENVDQALRDGYSTSGSLGSGLPAVQRLMSELSVESLVGRGTRIRAVRWLAHRSLETLDPPQRSSLHPHHRRASGRRRR